ncbi:hypothetical protein [Romboutsia lituseburensis]|uniref:hypothetical protein n=1 Tax=Romboutsia lituseburensis TaxID=1537 RepID=UPI00215B14C7|nr:hypothetical protein [Romboutsia lituseburensis]MCR8745233.1 hypothetical protein [Romboutsia lituseburensis]
MRGGAVIKELNKYLKQDREQLRDTVSLGDVKKSIQIVERLGVSKNKICLLSGVYASNYNSYEKGHRPLPDHNKTKILKTITDIFL